MVKAPGLFVIFYQEKLRGYSVVIAIGLGPKNVAGVCLINKYENLVSVMVMPQTKSNLLKTGRSMLCKTEKS